ncbi:iron chelate uptake ABC transporter family permease subunit [Aureimonas sp. Leaf454]|uniref:ABC transporter permease n=1 Tax=Aureimonas sp. Leaf454 TaxID=1736381 RepID=UPI000A89DA20|nr:iron chelate uptake ABC transporter family permease subunit [Aureimonas sp. Leaf454]
MSRFAVATLAVAVLAVASLFVGVGEVSLARLWTEGWSGEAGELLRISRLPRTLAILLAGAGMAVAGLIMQLLARNRFVEPSTAGTMESASAGLLAMMLLAPGAPVVAKMLVASLFALCGTGLFLAILSRVPLRSPLVVPLVGIMLGGVINAATSFFAYRFDLLQSLNAWMTGDFSGVLRGRYELLWIAFALTLAAYLAADRLTLAGLGKDVSTALGVDHGRTLVFGLVVVSLVTAAVTATVGMVPFVGLIVPNLVAMAIGDHARRAVPWVALVGAGFVLGCDMAGRIVAAPYELPVGSVVGVAGAAMFLTLLLRKRDRLG